MGELSGVTGSSSQNSRICSPLRGFGAPSFVWSVWALMLLLAVVFVATYGSNVPACEDFFIAETFAGHQQITVKWLWEAVGETPHRWPLPKLILIGLYRLSGDFR